MINRLFFFILFFIFGGMRFVSAVSPTIDYVISDFNSTITINQDTSLTITENIKVIFYTPKHGIYRTIPHLYSDGKKQINSKLRVDEILLDKQAVNFKVSNYNQSKQIKIGDPNLTITGTHEYQVTYRVNNVLQRYAEHDELYWNVTGHEWDATIKEASATVTSYFAKISKTDCFAGDSGDRVRPCQSELANNVFTVNSGIAINPGQDFTVVVALEKNNQLTLPGPAALLLQKILLILGLIILVLPSLFALYSWYSKGRDQRYLSDNIYNSPAGHPTRNVSVFERKYLPFAYQPIKGLSPAQAGTIIDEKVDIQDVVAEIIELARLGFLKIERKIEKSFLRTKTDYKFIPTQKDQSPLHGFQKQLLHSIFPAQSTESKVINGVTVKTEYTLPRQTVVLLSSLKNNFYQSLADIKSDLYKNMTDQKYFNGNPNRVKGIWFLKFLLVGIGCLFLVMVISGSTGNLIPLTLLPIIIPLNLAITIIAALKMPRRTALGYSNYRQLEGLRYFIDKGKWREEISEKHLFLEEILPLAICLGVVTKLTNDMKDLALQPPDYLTGFTTASFIRDFSNFSTTAASTLVSSPHSSGSSSWSGGSGFGGGGHSGGGFGGGGGGSW